MNGGHKISCVKCKIVRRPKQNGGLWLRDVRAIKLSLLVKWRWWLLQTDMHLSKVIFKAKYRVRVRVFIDWVCMQ